MKLSVLICNTDTRARNFLPEIVEDLSAQALGKEVEILWFGDNKMRTVGQKRNDLISLAQGDYFCFVDDDDKVAPTYISDILKATQKNPDLITFQAYRYHNGKMDRIVMYDMRYPKDENRQGRYERIPNHLCVWKKSKVEQVKFISSNYGEDSDWAIRVKNQCSIDYQHEIKKPLYFYYFNDNTTETQKF